MKTAIYIEDGIVQLVLTPQNKFEKDAVKELSKEKSSIQIYEGSFYDCRGGWIRQEEYAPHHETNFKDSLIIRVDKEDHVPFDKTTDLNASTENKMESNLKVVEVSKTLIPTAFGVWPEDINISDVKDPTMLQVATYRLLMHYKERI